MKRSFLAKDISRQIEINMVTRADSDLAEKALVKPVEFKITPDTLKNVSDVNILQSFIAVSSC